MNNQTNKINALPLPCSIIKLAMIFGVLEPLIVLAAPPPFFLVVCFFIYLYFLFWHDEECVALHLGHDELSFLEIEPGYGRREGKLVNNQDYHHHPT